MVAAPAAFSRSLSQRSPRAARLQQLNGEGCGTTSPVAGAPICICQRGAGTWASGKRCKNSKVTVYKIKQHLNPIFRLRVPKPYLPAPGPFKTSWRCLNASSVYVGMGETVVHSIRSKHLICHNFEELFCRPFGENTFRKTHPKRKSDHGVA